MKGTLALECILSEGTRSKNMVSSVTTSGDWDWDRDKLTQALSGNILRKVSTVKPLDSYLKEDSLDKVDFVTHYLKLAEDFTIGLERSSTQVIVIDVVNSKWKFPKVGWVKANTDGVVHPRDR
ncbi:hypothetical protein V6N11_069584 [Hibiscus sabdariffa]|uniref:Uncharacterized protein n=1 Tax=Hibiscus sabdariffa TaxID=183260 RepID=A0ABR2Q370_9ROSI